MSHSREEGVEEGRLPRDLFLHLHPGGWWRREEEEEEEEKYY